MEEYHANLLLEQFKMYCLNEQIQKLGIKFEVNIYNIYHVLDIIGLPKDGSRVYSITENRIVKFQRDGYIDDFLDIIIKHKNFEVIVEIDCLKLKNKEEEQIILNECKKYILYINEILLKYSLVLDPQNLN